MNLKKVENLKREIELCRSQLKEDWQNFDNASYEFVDVAIFNLKTTELKYQALCRELKREVFKENQKTY